MNDIAACGETGESCSTIEIFMSLREEMGGETDLGKKILEGIMSDYNYIGKCLAAASRSNEF